MIIIEKPQPFITKCNFCYSNEVVAILRMSDNFQHGVSMILCRECLDELKTEVLQYKLE